jgi:hypothetical protein
VMRVPAMMGLPIMIAGSILIRGWFPSFIT